MAEVRFGPFRMDLDTEELWKEGQRVPLAPKPSRALALLVDRAGALVRRADLYDALWGSTVVEFDQGLNTAIRQIRATLGDNPGSPLYIETVPRKGYRFIATVIPCAPRGDRWKRRFAQAAPVAVLVAFLGLGWTAVRGPTVAPGQPEPEIVGTDQYGRWTVAARHLLAEETPEDAVRALSILDSLVALYPDRTGVRADRAQALLRAGRPAEAQAERDLALRADSASDRAWGVHGALLLREWQTSAARTAFQRAVVLAPEIARHHHSLAYALALSGDHDLARKSMEQALELTPLAPAVHGDAGLFERWAGRLGAAEMRCREALRLVEARWIARPRRCLLRVAAERGDLLEARVQATHLLELAGLTAREISDVLEADEGLTGYWAWARRPENLVHSQGFIGPYAVALAAADAGDREGAIDALEEALRDESPALVQLSVETRFAALRGDSRFDAIARSVRSRGGVGQLPNEAGPGQAVPRSAQTT